VEGLFNLTKILAGTRHTTYVRSLEKYMIPLPRRIDFAESGQLVLTTSHLLYCGHKYNTRLFDTRWIITI
jgi:hypothetical protein